VHHLQLAEKLRQGVCTGIGQSLCAGYHCAATLANEPHGRL